jgi:succinate dehydrogenase / fumarate reductase cytochrome b subunit
MIPAEKKHFFLKRLHSLTGIAICGFILEHFFTNSASIHALFGNRELARETFNSHVSFLHALPLLLLIEIVALALPFIFHIAYGFYLTATGSSNLKNYPYERNLAYVLQRFSAIIIFLFLFVHVGELRFGWNLLPRPENQKVRYSAMNPVQKYTVIERSYREDRPGSSFQEKKIQHSDYYAHVADYFHHLPKIGWAFYILAIAATAFHFANGIFLAGITWGLWIRRQSQKTAFYLCMGMFFVLGAAGIFSLVGFGL